MAQAKQEKGYWQASDGTLTVAVRETACRCGCGLNTPSQAIIDALARLINAIDNKADGFTVESGCRCLKSNNAINNASKTSKHLPDAQGICHALDITNTKYTAKILLVFARGLFNNVYGIGYYPHMNIIHIDDRADFARWLYIAEYTPLTSFDLWGKYIDDREV